MEKGPVMVANIPQLYKGSYMFRNGFKEALELSHIKTDSIIALNYLSKEDLFLHPGIILPKKIDHSIELYPHLLISESKVDIKTNTPPYSRTIPIKNNTRFFYWNNETLVQLF